MISIHQSRSPKTASFFLNIRLHGASWRAWHWWCEVKSAELREENLLQGQVDISLQRSRQIFNPFPLPWCMLDSSLSEWLYPLFFYHCHTCEGTICRLLCQPALTFFLLVSQCGYNPIWPLQTCFCFLWCWVFRFLNRRRFPFAAFLQW